MKYIYISVRFRKNVVVRFSPGFGQSPNPGQASDSKPRGGGAPSRLAWVYSPGLDLSAGGLFGVQQSKAGGWGELYFTDTLCLVDFEVL